MKEVRAAWSANGRGLNEICIQIVILMFFRGAKIIGIYIHSRALCRDSGERKYLRLSLHNIQQFIGNGLLATLVVLMRQCLQQLVGIVAGDLHSDHAGGMFGGRGIK